MNIETNKINAWALNEKKLRDELANEISRKFGIDKLKAKNLISKEALHSLDSLKEVLNKNNDFKETLDDKKLEELFLTLKWALEVIENISKIDIKVLKEDVEKHINIDEFKNNLEDILPKKLLEKAKNPKALHHHILWFSLGSANTIIATADILYQIWAWIIKIPYHLYLIVTGKWEIKNFKNI